MIVTERTARETAREFASRTIKKNIINLELAPGSLVSESEIAAILGLSRTPVREALMELGKTNLVEILPQKGSRISLIDYSMVEESRFIRLVLECAIVKLLCGGISKEAYACLQEKIRLQEFYVEHNEPFKLLELDNDFHRELFSLANRMQTYQLMNSMTSHFDRVRSMSLSTIKDIKIVEDHIEILQAIYEKDPEKAEALMTKHLSRYKIDENFIRTKYPAYFKA
ncbi:transcriptional regulator [Sphaerochaeta pleomorpha str. Grapes]|uniref:Transcriptional regulator n=1 Tax=Sphaerochaeta pleomorpha (strain ATCC BAA-1885 / DSM 22778 / Grapes) TaxID=158190 RepID=G8QU57_SPHPG|nr:GntR family transcriptional regulator [Sphaerochaeta pleomorpha]AEV30304.1 transcriptional regulator [Sphaerochaeta pleomorpha str. Grapes]